MKALETKPEVYEDLVHVWNAFWDLHSMRQVSEFGPSAILASEILAWLTLSDVDESEYAITYNFIHIMDIHYLTLIKETRPKHANTNRGNRRTRR